MSKTRLHLFCSIAFLLSSIALWTQVRPIDAPLPSNQPAVVQVAPPTTFAVEGVWEQYYVSGNERQFMARLDLRQSGPDFVANPLELSADAYPKHAYRSFGHTYQDGHWSFKEEWGCGSVGQFDLELQPNGEYEGWAFSQYDGHGFQTVFVRVK